MVIFVKLLGIIIVAFGVAYLVNPNIMKPYMAFWKKGKRLYMGAALSLLIGIIFLLAASQTRIGWFIALFGILALAKGIWLLVTPAEKLISMLEWWAKRPVAFLRVHALFAIAIGALLIYCA